MRNRSIGKPIYYLYWLKRLSKYDQCSKVELLNVRTATSYATVQNHLTNKTHYYYPQRPTNSAHIQLV